MLVGGSIRRIAIITTGHEPCAAYLARRLRRSGAQIALVSQREASVPENSWRYFRRLLSKRGPWICADNVLLYGANRMNALTRRLGRLAWRAFPRGLGSSQPASLRLPPALQEDSAILGESWLDHLDVTSINRPPDQERLRALRPDLIVLAGAPIVTARTIEIASVACLNSHCGITPKYCGNSPAVWAIYEGQFTEVGFTLHQVTAGVDTGPIVYQERVSWNPEDGLADLWPLLAQRMYDKLADVVIAMVRGERFEATPQTGVRVLPPAGFFARRISDSQRRRYLAATRASRSRIGTNASASR